MVDKDSQENDYREGKSWLRSQLESRMTTDDLSMRGASRIIGVSPATLHRAIDPDDTSVTQPDVLKKIARFIELPAIEVVRQAYGLTQEDKIGGEITSDELLVRMLLQHLTDEQRALFLNLVKGGLAGLAIEYPLNDVLEIAAELEPLDRSWITKLWARIDSTADTIFNLYDEASLLRDINEFVQEADAGQISDEEIERFITHPTTLSLINALAPFRRMSALQKLFYLTYSKGTEEKSPNTKEIVQRRIAALRELAGIDND
jgi:hypothetical protein